jgi:hypothetical protein
MNWEVFAVSMLGAIVIVGAFVAFEAVWESRERWKKWCHNAQEQRDAEREKGRQKMSQLRYLVKIPIPTDKDQVFLHGYFDTVESEREKGRQEGYSEGWHRAVEELTEEFNANKESG